MRLLFPAAVTAALAAGLLTAAPAVAVAAPPGWHDVSPAGAPEAVGVSCADAQSCLAIAPGSSLTWNGHRWSRPDRDIPGGGLVAVSCPAAGACTAVGNYGSLGSQGDGSPTALAEAWDGTSWQTQHVPNPKGNPPTQLTGVSCPSALACSAVGTDTITGIAEAWSGDRWSLQTPASPAHTDGTNLSSVWCVSAHACTAVGDYFNFFVSPLTLAITTADSPPA
jgi:hypothetical protein